ncbi:serine/threonine protein kinase [Myxococcus sp. K15C18031901]|uniref:serine/threonine-protein kinase n=1 Tax=Myxococcus dinghuensis TaxID=2906761 RepID=UPI0020A7CC74|nr:serine/threonine-protein kinase [Myxococcus dinghuensis]MCP3103079.1 serine/threonine protein kinase [Myxococcus dinghuensis]
MSASRKCPRCGVEHREGVTVCPREVFRPGVAQAASYRGDERDITLKRDDGADRQDDDATRRDDEATQAAVRPLVEGVPAAFMARMLRWEESVTNDLLVGKQLGDYVLKRRIGSGGMGIVYEGEHAVIGRKVAIKILRPDFAEGARTRDLAAEARAAASIRHRGIIDIFGFGTIPDIGQYLVMEYLDGAPLDEVIQQRAPLREPEVITLLDALLSALAAAHSVGVIHRDLKPGNVFMVRESDGTESVKVLDFGIAKRSEAPYGSTPQTHASTMVGTPEYVAPEQACGQQVSPQTDLYAVGVIAFEMLTRRLPFEGETPLAIVVQHVRKPAPPPSTYVSINRALELLVLRLLEKEPSARPASAEAVRRELKLILTGLTGTVTQLTGPKAEVRVPAQPKPGRAERRQRRVKASPPPRRNSDSDIATHVIEVPTALMDATALDHATLGRSRARRMTLAVGGVFLAALFAGGGCLWSSRRKEMPSRQAVPVAAESVPDNASEEGVGQGMGTLVLMVDGVLEEVLVDGRSHGKSHLFTLPEGTHRIEVRGGADNALHRSIITILAGELTEHHVTLL